MAEKLEPGTRIYSRYTSQEGTIGGIVVDGTDPWYDVTNADGSTTMLNAERFEVIAAAPKQDRTSDRTTELDLWEASTIELALRRLAEHWDATGADNGAASARALADRIGALHDDMAIGGGR